MIYLLRHGETVWNTERRMQGRQDSPLNLHGIGQARALGGLLGELLEGSTEYRIVSSPQGRAWQTAVIVAGELGAPPQDILTDPRLAELAYGQWEGFTIEEIKAQQREAGAHRATDRWNIAAPGGESYADVAVRTKSWLSEISESEQVIAVCHGGTSRVIRGLVARIPEEETLDLAQPQDSLFRLSGGRVDELKA